MSELVRLERLKRYYGTYLAFEADEVVLEPGVIGLLGPNGAGKSTLLNMLMGLLAPSSGRAWMLGFDTAKESRRARSRVGYMPENDSFVAGLTVLQFVSLAGELHGQKPVAARRRAHEVLSLLGLEEARYRLIEEQPTGIRQRAKLAQALINNPDLVILDEPTNGLDPAGRSAMLELISRLHQDQGKSILLSSHLLGDVSGSAIQLSFSTRAGCWPTARWAPWLHQGPTATGSRSPAPGRISASSWRSREPR